MKQPLKRNLFLLATLPGLLTACGGSSESDYTAEAIPAGHSVPAQEADVRASAIVEQMSMSQKISLVHGHGSPNGMNGYLGISYPQVPGALDEAVGFTPSIESLGVPANNMVDASNGVTVEGLHTTALPVTVALASTWSKDIAYQYGSRIGAEARLLGFTTALGGGVNLIKDPRNGRGFEYMGEDPILAGELGAYRTIGVQENKIISTIKHFAFNNYETNRMIGNAIVDEQTMRETELLAFEIAITKGNPGYIMCAFNQVNGQYSCENEYLLNEVLKGEWGYKGMVMSDWGAQSSTIDAANNGLDEEQAGRHEQDTEVPYFFQLIMGGPYFIDSLVDAVETGQVPQSRLDDMVFRKVRTMVAVGLMDEPPQDRSQVNETVGNADARAIADASMVLLKNEPATGVEANSVLPLDKETINSIVVVGGFADKGVLSGGGSGGHAALIENQYIPEACGQLPISPYPSCPNYIGVTPLEAIEAEFPNAEVTFFDGRDATAAANAASEADVAIVFGASWLSEGTDKLDMHLDSPTNDSSGVYDFDQDALIEAVAFQANKTVVVLETGHAVLMPWVDQVDAVLQAWYPGVQGAYSIADILSGDVNPSGKLPLTFPASEGDLAQPNLPTNLGTFMGQTVAFKSFASLIESLVTQYVGEGMYDYLRQYSYSEKLHWNGYKYMDANNIEPLFHFGHGLSYSSYDYSAANASLQEDGSVSVSFTLTNSSQVDGIEIAQVYVSLPDTVPGNVQPPKRLAGWARVELAAGESQTVTVEIPRKYISTWDVDADRWITTPGEYTFIVSDSADTHSTNTLITAIDVD